MKIWLREGVVALATMDGDALGGPETVEQPRAVLHVIAQAEQIGDEKEYLVGRLLTSFPDLRLRRFYFLLARRS